MLKALKVNPDKSIEELDMDVPDKLSLFQSAVGGYIEGVYLDGINARMYMDEEYLFKKEPHEANIVASILFEREYDQSNLILGPVVIFGGYDDEGEVAAIGEEAERIVRSIAEMPDFLTAMYGYA